MPRRSNRAAIRRRFACLDFAGNEPATAEARLTALVPRLMADADIPGLTIALVRDEQIVWQHSFGVANAQTRRPVTRDTVFQAASLSKPVFAYAVLKLVLRDPRENRTA